MKTATLFAAALLGASVSAAPFQRKRDYVYDVVTQEIIETVLVTTTVWVDPPAATPEGPEPYEPTEPEAETTDGAFYENPAAAPAPTPAAPLVKVPAPAASAAPVQLPAANPPAPAPEVTKAPAAAPSAPAPAPAVEKPVFNPPAPAPAPSAAPEPSKPSSSGGQYSGEMTYYAPGMGACGEVNSESDWIVAIAWEQFDERSKGVNPNLNGWCGQKININYLGETFSARVTDRCGGCKKGDLDMPQAMFDKITKGTGDGRTRSGMTWDLS